MLTTLLFPEVLQYTNNTDPEVRGVLISCIRNLLPSLIKASVIILERYPNAPYQSDVPINLFYSFFSIVPGLLRDYPPIPQYVSKLVLDLGSIDYSRDKTSVMLKEYVYRCVSGLPDESRDILALHRT